MSDKSALATLVGAYLHEDVFELYADEFAAVDAFVSGAPDIATALIDDIDDVLSRSSGEEELRRSLEALGLAIEPAAGVTYREWLTQIADRARAVLP